MWIMSDVALMCRYLAGVSPHRAFHVTGMGVTVLYMLHVDGKRVVVMGVGSHWLEKKALWVS
jgi:hypothetical protein